MTDTRIVTEKVSLVNSKAAPALVSIFPNWLIFPQTDNSDSQSKLILQTKELIWHWIQSLGIQVFAGKIQICRVSEIRIITMQRIKAIEIRFAS